MAVEATRGDPGEEDISKPKVSEVIQDEQGNVDKFVVKKGLIFKKTLEIPADRTSIDQKNGGNKSEQEEPDKQDERPDHSEELVRPYFSHHLTALMATGINRGVRPAPEFVAVWPSTPCMKNARKSTKAPLSRPITFAERQG
jgi:hypothetical protein